MNAEQMILMAREKGCSDIHVSEGMDLTFRINGRLMDSGIYMSAAESRELIMNMLSSVQKGELESGKDLDFAIQTPDGNRQR